MSISQLYPEGRPSFEANFARTKKVPPEFQYSRASTGTYVGSDGLIKTAVAGQPRFDCDPLTGDAKGLFVEESRTNLCTYSETFLLDPSVWWNNINASQLPIITTNAGIAPNGTNSATLINESDCTFLKNNSPGTVASANESITFSIWLKAGSRTSVTLRIFASEGTSPTATFNLSNGTFIINNPVDSFNASMISYTNEWYRCIISRSATISTKQPPNFQLGGGSTTFYAWGAQIEKNQINASSYIPTTTTSVTRAADTLTAPSRIFSNQLNSSIVVESETTISEAPVFSLNDGTTSNETKVLVYPTAGTWRLFSNDLNIVKNGLVLNLDAGNPASYPGSGTTWTDLSDENNNGTLVNGVGYDSGNGGSLVFDGVDDYVRCTPKNSTTNGLYFGGATSISVSAWVKNNTTNTFNNFVMYEDVVNSNGVEPVRLATRGHVGDNTAIFSIVQNDSSYNAISNTILNNTNYYYLTGTFGGGYVKIYVNGIFESQSSLSGSMDVPNSGTSARWFVGAGELGDPRYLNGNIAQASIYNRELTAAEVQQNFNALRGRFAL